MLRRPVVFDNESGLHHALPESIECMGVQGFGNVNVAMLHFDWVCTKRRMGHVA